MPQTSEIVAELEEKLDDALGKFEALTDIVETAADECESAVEAIDEVVEALEDEDEEVDRIALAAVLTSARFGLDATAQSLKDGIYI